MNAKPALASRSASGPGQAETPPERTIPAPSPVGPRIALVAWLISVAMVPIWVGVQLGPMWIPLHCIVALFGIAVCSSQAQILFTKFDAYFVIFLVTALAAILFSGWGMGKAAFVELAIHWGIPYLAARVIVSATGIRFALNAIAVTLSVVGFLAIVEAVLSWHPFTGWYTTDPQYKTWSPIQTRAGRDRSEWAFGHSIALGGSLALAIPLVFQPSWKWSARVGALLLLIGGVVASGSRGALVACGLTLAICVVYISEKPSVRILSLVFGVGLAFLTFSNYSQLVQNWLRSGSEGDIQSAEHRSQIYDRFLTNIKVFGQFAFDRKSRRGEFSIDSAILDFGLTFGWIVLILATLPLAISALRVGTGRGSLVEIALAGQIPLLATVALITQYRNMVLLFAGLAVQMALEAKRQDEPPEWLGSGRRPARDHQSRMGGQSARFPVIS